MANEDGRPEGPLAEIETIIAEVRRAGDQQSEAGALRRIAHIAEAATREAVYQKPLG